MPMREILVRVSLQIFHDSHCGAVPAARFKVGRWFKIPARLELNTAWLSGITVFINNHCPKSVKTKIHSDITLEEIL